MRRVEDPLQEWLTGGFALDDPGADRSQLEGAIRSAVEKLSSALARQSKSAWATFPPLASVLEVGAVAPELLLTASATYLKLVEAKATGKQHAEEALLMMLGKSAEAALLPFWRDVLAIERLKDTYAARRKIVSYAALAHLHLQRNVPEALELLKTGLDAKNPGVRANAMRFLVMAIAGKGGVLDGEAESLARKFAVEEKGFEARFLMRSLLAEHGRDVPGADGALYAFEVVYLRNRKTTRTIEVSSKDTLFDLHGAILGSLGWEDDHLHEFQLAGPDGDARFSVPTEEGGPVENLTLGQLGFTKGHRFTYLFDFGDSHWFGLRVIDTDVPRVKGARYPRVAKSAGGKPKQYDDEDW